MATALKLRCRSPTTSRLESSAQRKMRRSRSILRRKNSPKKAAQIGVKLVAEVAMHQVTTVLVRHHLQGGILGETFRHHVGTFDIGADELVCPPLMAQFVSSDEVGEVDVGGLQYAPNEANAF